MRIAKNTLFCPNKVINLLTSNKCSVFSESDVGNGKNAGKMISCAQWKLGIALGENPSLGLLQWENGLHCALRGGASLRVLNVPSSGSIRALCGRPVQAQIKWKTAQKTEDEPLSF